MIRRDENDGIEDGTEDRVRGLETSGKAFVEFSQ